MFCKIFNDEKLIKFQNNFSDQRHYLSLDSVTWVNHFKNIKNFATVKIKISLGEEFCNNFHTVHFFSGFYFEKDVENKIMNAFENCSSKEMFTYLLQKCFHFNKYLEIKPLNYSSYQKFLRLFTLPPLEEIKLDCIFNKTLLNNFGLQSEEVSLNLLLESFTAPERINLEIPKNIELICNEIDTLNFPLPSKAFGIIPLHHSNSLQYYKEPNRLFFR